MKLNKILFIVILMAMPNLTQAGPKVIGSITPVADTFLYGLQPGLLVRISNPGQETLYRTGSGPAGYFPTYRTSIDEEPDFTGSFAIHDRFVLSPGEQMVFYTEISPPLVALEERPLLAGHRYPFVPADYQVKSVCTVRDDTGGSADLTLSCEFKVIMPNAGDRKLFEAYIDACNKSNSGDKTAAIMALTKLLAKSKNSQYTPKFFTSLINIHIKGSSEGSLQQNTEAAMRLSQEFLQQHPNSVGEPIDAILDAHLSYYRARHDRTGFINAIDRLISGNANPDLAVKGRIQIQNASKKSDAQFEGK